MDGRSQVPGHTLANFSKLSLMHPQSIALHTESPSESADRKSTGQLEAQVSEAMTKFERNYFGRGPHRVRTYMLDDMVVVRLEGLLSPAEQQLVKNPEGAKLLKEIRSSLIENAEVLLCDIIRDILKRDIVSLHASINAKIGERVIIFTLKPTD